MKNRLFLFAGILSFVSAFFVVAGLLISYVLTPFRPQSLQSLESLSETFIFLFAPVLLLPAILAVYRLLAEDYPRLALLSLLLGLVGFGGLLLWSVLAALAIVPMASRNSTVLYLELMLMGFWTMITAVSLLIFEANNLVLGSGRTVFNGFLFLSGLVCGIAMILYAWSVLPAQPILAVTNVSILIWLISYPCWLIGLGVCLLTYSHEPALVSS